MSKAEGAKRCGHYSRYTQVVIRFQYSNAIRHKRYIRSCIANILRPTIVYTYISSHVYTTCCLLRNVNMCITIESRRYIRYSITGYFHSAQR